jgi:hypothetical protein
MGPRLRRTPFRSSTSNADRHLANESARPAGSRNRDRRPTYGIEESVRAESHETPHRQINTGEAALALVVAPGRKVLDLEGLTRCRETRWRRSAAPQRRGARWAGVESYQGRVMAACPRPGPTWLPRYVPSPQGPVPGTLRQLLSPASARAGSDIVSNRESLVVCPGFSWRLHRG